MTRTKVIKFIGKPILFILCLLPLLLLGWNALTDSLSANPISDVTNTTGTWTLRFLAITLAVTPLRKITKLHFIIQFRRMIGLFAFFYAVLHFTTYIWLDQFFQFNDILKDVVKRPFITVGFTAFLMLIPLAVTSTRKMIQRMRGKSWNRLHKLIYVAAAAGVIHYYWLVKADTSKPIFYGCLIGILLLFRLAAFVVSAYKAKRKALASFAATSTIKEEALQPTD